MPHIHGNPISHPGGHQVLRQPLDFNYVGGKQECRSGALADRHSQDQINWVATFSEKKASIMSPFFTSL